MLFRSHLECLAVVGDDLAEQVVPVESLPQVVDLVPRVCADGAVGGRLEVVEVVDAPVRLVDVEEGGRDQVEVEDNIWERRRDIVIPVSGAIGNDEALQRKSLCLLVNLDQ